MNSACPSERQLSNFACPGQVLVKCFYYLLGRYLAWALPHCASENEKLQARQENLLVWDDRMALFFTRPELGWLQTETIHFWLEGGFEFMTFAISVQCSLVVLYHSSNI